MSVPQHSATAAIRYLKAAAFDTDRVADERKSMPDDGNDHPVVIYFSGRSRYDLDAPYPVGGELRKPREYLKPDHGCPMWSVKRLGAVMTARLQDIGGHVAELDALCRGFEAVDVDVPGLGYVPGKVLSEGQIEKLAEQFGLEDLYAVGAAILRASAAPTVAEGKR